MAHKHSVYDTDTHFIIDGVTRAVKNASQTKTMLVQHDHNSERFTFEIPRKIDDHDMSICNAVQVHYINIDSSDNTKQYSGVYGIDDLQISPESDDVVICSWLISANATQYVGNLSFVVRFMCVSDDGSVDYVWNTAVHSNVFVSKGIYNGEPIVEEYADILAQWEARIQALEEGVGTVKTVNGIAPDENGNVRIQNDSEVANVVFRPGSISTSGGIVDGSNNEMICEGITLDGYDFLDIQLADSENWNLGLYAFKADGTLIQYNSGNFIYHGTVRCDDPTLEYAIRAKNLGTSDNFTTENAKNAFVITRGNFDRQCKQDAIGNVCRGENVYFPCKEPLYEQTFGTSGYKGDRDNAVTRPISIGDFDGIRFSFSDPGYFYKLYSVSESGTVKTINSAIEAPSEYVFTDKGLKYVLVVDKMGSADNYAQEDMDAIHATHTIEHFYINTLKEENTAVYGYSRQYTDITHLLNWENLTVDEYKQTQPSDTAVMAKLPSGVCVEVKKNQPYGRFRIFDYYDPMTSLMVCDYNEYAYRCIYFPEDGSEFERMVEVSSVKGEEITPETVAEYIRVFTFNDVGVTHSKSNPSLYGKKIAVIGDSIVQGRFCKYGTTVNLAMTKPWSHHIAESCNVEPANFGIGGARVQNNDWRSLYRTCENVSGYDVVFVCAGTNDYGGNVDMMEFISAFSHVLETLVANNTEVVVCTPVYRTNKTAENTAGYDLLGYAEAEKDEANTANCRVIDLYTLTNTNAFKATLTDGLHPNEVGQKMIADIVLENY